MSLLKLTIKNKGAEIANEEYQYENITDLMNELKKANQVIHDRLTEIIDTLGQEGVKKVKKNYDEDDVDDIQDNE